MPKYFKHFQQPIHHIELPDSMDYPFYYQPHPIAIKACEEVQLYLENQSDFIHNFGLDKNDNSPAIGKMFGVLVCENEKQEIGYITAFSGKLANTNEHLFFVPPIFDMLNKDGFFLQQEERLNEINRTLVELENNHFFIQLKKEIGDFETSSNEKIEKAKIELKSNKQHRKVKREVILPTLSIDEAKLFEEDLIKQSLRDKHEFRVLIQEIENKKQELKEKLNFYTNQIVQLKEERKFKSNSLQNQLFDQYQFLNINKEKKGLREIFETTAAQMPPAGSGECAAPKLFQYAFENNLKPICMAEFWWGESPKSEIRKHKNYYPACTGKCEPILGHMLKGIKMNDNPLIKQFEHIEKIEIIYQDEDLVVVNKPEEFLSVPGIEIKDSVYERMKHQFPQATGPLIIHRLDMATSGLLVLALNKESHKAIQQQFIKRIVSKRYIALLDGIIPNDEGTIELPLRVDLDDRPRQVVCYEHGKMAKTDYKVLKRSNNRTLIQFYPITGRTHQLRMHAAHPLGLNTPIVGDDLYGKKSTRLFLHAEYLEFIHPRTKELINFKVEPNFNL